jgi:hypothetical protein
MSIERRLAQTNGQHVAGRTRDENLASNLGPIARCRG